MDAEQWSKKRKTAQTLAFSFTWYRKLVMETFWKTL